MNSFKEKVIYQVYPKSFLDTNGDGIGDLQGIIQKIPYLAELGIDMIWLNPFYPSPQRDNGYDVADYVAVDPMFGSMEDFDQLVQVAKDHGIDLMLDMVFNHTSTDHEWFQKALAGDPYYQDFYYIRPPKADGSLPTNWQSKFGGPAWAAFGDTGLYYLHLYDQTQADLDWHNPNVQKEMIAIVNFWLAKGVKGFRFDVLNVLGKDVVLVDSDGSPAQEKALYTDTPIVHDYIQMINQGSFGQREDIVTVGEMSSTTIENGILYTQPDRKELSMIFSFHHLKVDYDQGEKWSKIPFRFLELKQLIHEWQEGMAQGQGWNALFWNNHDQPRANSRFADPDNYPYESSTMLATTMHLLRGTPFIYQGEELGMTNPNFDRMDQYVDVESLNAYDALLESGMNEDQALALIKDKSRDNSRTPMQWTGEDKGGFTSGKAWLDLGKNVGTINAEAPISQSIYAYYQKLIQLRKTLPLVAQGDYQGLLLDHPSVLAYSRHYQGETLLVLNNFYGQEVTLTWEEIGLDLSRAQLVLTNVADKGLEQEEKRVVLGPYQSLAVKL